MKTKILFFLTLGLFLCFASCNTDDDPVLEQPVTKETLSGYVQKGPFISGSSVLIYELDNHLNQTGRSYSTTVADNTGSFEQKQVELISDYVQLKADGYYFNEVGGKPSPGQLTLYALADVSGVGSTNVNVLTHLERSRTEYLVREQGLAFAVAKAQAQREVLAIFSLELPDNATSESLNLINSSVLLAVSCILQGQLTTAAMSELMADIIADIRTDGKLDKPETGSQLIDNARLVNTSAIRQNLERKYAEPGMGSVTIPDFERNVKQFMEKTAYEPKIFVTYPATGKYGINILAENVTEIKYLIDNGPPKNFYSMKAELPEGTALKVILKNGEWYHVSIPSPENWTVGSFDKTNRTQEFTVTRSGSPGDLGIRLEPGNITVEYYEYGATVPTRIKQLKVESTVAPNDSTTIYP